MTPSDSWPPTSKTTDPVTSHIAEEKITASGKRQTHALIVLGFIRRYSDQTSGEIAAGLHAVLNLYQVRRRLPDLEHLGLIEKSGTRKCSQFDSLQCTWRVPRPLENEQGVLL